MAIDYNIPAPPGKPDYDEEENFGDVPVFWPVLILIIGMFVSTGYQIMAMQEQLASLNQALVQMEPKVKQAQYEKAKLYKLASDILQLAATDPGAKQIAADYKIEQRAAAPDASQTPGAATTPASAGAASK
jgi:hypothetical protein